MSVNEEKGIKYDHKGQTFYFCSNLCKRLFERNPESYSNLNSASAASGMATERSIAYFSMEIAIDPRIPTYSGGLGVLSGDTLRSCADLNVPAVAVTLL